MKKNMKIIVMCLLIIFAVLSCNTKEKKAKVDYVLVNPNPVNVARGTIRQFTAHVVGENRPSQGVTWSITGNNSSLTTISNGKLTVDAEESASLISVIATSNQNKKKNGTAFAGIVTPIPTVSYISLTPLNTIVARGGYQNFTAEVYGKYNPPQTVTWSITGNSSSRTTISTSGRLSIDSSETMGTITVLATSTYDTEVSAFAYANIHKEYTTISFGGKSWRVLETDTQNNRALIISFHALGYSNVYHTSNTDITWENCFLRDYLNNTFYHSFSASDQDRILTTVISNSDNPVYGTPGGNPTSDKIFLLSIAEAQTYFSSDADRTVESEIYGSITSWWLRSPGNFPYTAAFVDNYGEIYMRGASVNVQYSMCLRPALWINM